jgi:predicted nucleotidyltransferase
MKTKEGLTRNKIVSLLRRHEDMLKKYKVKRIGVFGSYAKGTQTSKSDVDFLVEFERPSFDDYMALAEDLEKLLGKKIDLLTPEGVRSIRVKEVAENIRRSVLYV